MSKKKGKKNEIIVRYTQTFSRSLARFCERHSVFITCVGWYTHIRTHSKFTQDHIYISNLRHSYELCFLAFVFHPPRSRTCSSTLASWKIWRFRSCLYYGGNICEVNVWFLFLLLFPNVRMLTQWFWWMLTSTPNGARRSAICHNPQSHNSCRIRKYFYKIKRKYFHLITHLLN